MKTLFVWAALLSVFVFHSCSGSDSDEHDKDITTTTPVSLVGVWQKGNFFISFDSKGFYAAYLDDEFIDSGNYNQSKDVVKCNNMYFNRTTTYTIKSISDENLEVDISYMDLYGSHKNRTITFTKTDNIPASIENTLSGKSYTGFSSTFGNVTMTFSAYNAGIKNASKGSAAKYPLSFFYIYIGNKLYYQLLDDDSIQIPSIGSWTDYNIVKCWKIYFSLNGSISNIENEAL
jgi:hypothetical protein